ncbi:MAG: FAD-dependent oxidoreductase, partial [Rubrobacteraceae bacterium]
FKFGKYFHLEEQGDAEELDREVHGYDERVLREFAERYFPEGCGPTMSLQTCMFTNTPDHHFVLDLHPDYEQVSIASACSGHGFKFASVIGEIMADLSTTGVTRHNIDFFRLDRFQRQGRRRYQGDRGRRPAVRTAQTTGRGDHQRDREEDARAHEQNGRPHSFPRVPEVKPFW